MTDDDLLFVKSFKQLLLEKMMGLEGDEEGSTGLDKYDSRVERDAHRHVPKPGGSYGLV